MTDGACEIGNPPWVAGRCLRAGFDIAFERVRWAATPLILCAVQVAGQPTAIQSFDVWARDLERDAGC